MRFPHGVVARDDAVLLGAEDVLERAGKSHEGRAGVRGRAGEAGVVRRPEELLEKAIGLGHGGDPGEAQLLGQALLQGPEHALRAAPGLRRIGRDQLDAELRQGADLGRVVLVHTAACLGRVPVVRGPMRRASRTARFRRSPRRARGTSHRAGNEEARIDLDPSMVTVPPLAQPTRARAVLVQIIPTTGRRGRFRRCAPRLDAGLILPCACKLRRSQL